MISLAESDWQKADLDKVSNLNVTIEGVNYLKDQHGRNFHHFCTTSYLGLDYHPALLKGAIDANSISWKIMSRNYHHFFPPTA